MSQQLNTSKSYGVLHTENYFSFLGFSKKVNSDEIQKIDIYLDDKLIDTITADKHIEKIEDIYELAGFGFTYILPNEYVGKKSSISFKNHETKEHLQNSPYTLIDETHPKFNEFRFLHSLTILNNKKLKIKKEYPLNTIGFLLTSHTLQDKEFIKFVLEIACMKESSKIKIFYFEDLLQNELKALFSDLEKFELISIYNLKNIFSKVNFLCIYSYNSQDTIIKNFIAENTDILVIIYDKNFANTLLSIYDKNYGNLYSPYTYDYLELGLNNTIINSPLKTIYKYIFNCCISDEDFNKKTFKDFYIDTFKFSNNMFIKQTLLLGTKKYLKHYGN